MPGDSIFCATCSFNEGCPKFRQGDFQPQWEPAVTRLEQLKEERSTLDIRIKEIESALKQAHQLASTTDWISTGQHRFRLGMSSGRRTLDRKGLHRNWRISSMRKVLIISMWTHCSSGMSRKESLLPVCPSLPSTTPLIL